MQIKPLKPRAFNLYKDCAQLIPLSSKEHYAVITDKRRFDTGTFLISERFDLKKNKVTYDFKRISSKPILIVQRIFTHEMGFIEVRYLERDDTWKTHLIDVQEVTVKSYEGFKRLGIVETAKTHFAHAMVAISTSADTIPVKENVDVNPGWSSDFSDFLIVGRDAIREDATSVICEPYQPRDDQDRAELEAFREKFIRTIEKEQYALARNMMPCLISGFITKAVRLTNNPIYWFWDRQGNSGKTTIARLLNAGFTAQDSILSLSSTAVGIERTAYSCSDAYLLADEVQHYAGGDKVRTAHMVHGLAIGGNRVKAGRGAKTNSLSFKLSVILLSNISATDHLSGTPQEGPVLSRLLELEVPPLDATTERFAEDAKELSELFDEAVRFPGFLLEPLLEYIKTNRGDIVSRYHCYKSHVIKSIGQSTLNGRNNDIIAIYLTASDIMLRLFGLSTTKEFAVSMINQYKVSESEAVNTYLDKLNQVYNILFKHLRITGYFAESENDLTDTQDIDGKIISASTKQRKKADFISSQNAKNGLLGGVMFNRAAVDDITSFDDAEYFMLTKSGLDELKKHKINIDQLITYAKGRGCIRVTQSEAHRTLPYRDKRLGRVLCFDLGQLRACISDDKV